MGEMVRCWSKGPTQWGSSGNSMYSTVTILSSTILHNENLWGGWQYWGLNSRPVFARQALYHLNHTSSPFCFSCFLERVLCLCHSQSGLELSHSCSGNVIHVPPHPAYWLRWGLTNFFPGMASIHDPPNHYLWVPGIMDMNCWAQHVLIFCKESRP
jgi:hypothetical protein